MNYLFELVCMINTCANPSLILRKNTAPTENDPWRGGLVWGEVHDEIAYKTGGLSGHAGLFSTAKDLFELGKLWLNLGLKDGKEIIPKYLISMAIINNFPKAISAGTPQQEYGLGWRLHDRRFTGDKVSYPTYDFSGFTGPSLMIDPDKDIVVAILNNRVHPSRYSKVNRSLFHARIVNEIYKAI